MRVLIISAIIACVYAAPSHYAAVVPYASVPYSGVPYASVPYSAVPYASVPYAAVPYAVPLAAAPTVPAGDIQAANINAQVKAADIAQFTADQAREQAEIAAENQFEGVVEANDLVKEKSEEAFWAAEEKKWQAVNNLQTAEAKIDGSVANNVDAIAKGYPVAGVVGLPATGLIAGDAVAPEAEAVVAAKAVPEAPIESSVASDNSVTVEAADEKKSEVKSASVEEKSEVKAEIEKSVESEKKEETPDLKSALSDAFKAQNIALEKLSLKPSILPAPVVVAPGYYQAISSPLSYQSAFRAYPVAPLQPAFGHVYPTVIKNGW